MKIAIFSDNFYPELSGVADSVISLSKELAVRNHEIKFFAPKYSKKNFEKVGLPFGEIDLGPNISVHRFPSFTYPAPTGQARAVLPSLNGWQAVKQFAPDVIHSQLFFGVGLEALRAVKKLNIPFVGTNHTAITEFVKYSPVRGEWVKKMFMNYAVWYYNKCDFVTAPSESVFSEMLPNGFDKPHRAISNPIDLGMFNPIFGGDSLAIKNKFGLTGPTIVYAGRLADEKNIDVLIRAVALIKDKVANINLALAGHGTIKEKLSKLASELGVSENIKFLGTIPKKDLADVYRVSDIFAIASISETQSLTLMQGMACGLPAVGVNSRALPEYITNEVGFIVKPGDYKSMADKFSLLLTNRETRETMGRAAGEYLKKFSAPSIAQQWESLYDEVINSKQ